MGCVGGHGGGKEKKEKELRNQPSMNHLNQLQEELDQLNRQLSKDMSRLNEIPKEIEKLTKEKGELAVAVDLKKERSWQLMAEINDLTQRLKKLGKNSNEKGGKEKIKIAKRNEKKEPKNEKREEKKQPTRSPSSFDSQFYQLKDGFLTFSAARQKEFTSGSLSYMPDDFKLIELLSFKEKDPYLVETTLNQVKNFQNVRKIVIRDCQIDEIPPAIESFARLEELDVQQNRIDGEIRGIEGLRIKRLLASSNFIDSLGPLPPSIEELYLCDNEFYGATLKNEWLERFPNLKTLVLAHNVFHLPTSSSSHCFPRLEKLIASDASLSSLPPHFMNSKNVTWIDLSENEFREIPAGLKNFKNLEHLNLSMNELHGSMPKTLGTFKRLKFLSLTGNENLRTLPGTLGNLTRLEYLFMNDTSLETLPESVGNLKNLKVLDLSATSVSRLPKSIQKLTSLLHLSLSDVEPSGPLHLEAKSLAGVVRFDLANFNFFKLDSKSFVHCRHLNLQLTDIDNLPKSFSQGFPNLVTLDIANNCFERFPSELSTISSLFYINLNGNPLCDGLPDAIASMAALVDLPYASAKSEKLFKLDRHQFAGSYTDNCFIIFSSAHLKRYALFRLSIIALCMQRNRERMNWQELNPNTPLLSVNGYDTGAHPLGCLPDHVWNRILHFVFTDFHIQRSQDEVEETRLRLRQEPEDRFAEQTDCFFLDSQYMPGFCRIFNEGESDDKWHKRTITGYYRSVVSECFHFRSQNDNALDRDEILDLVPDRSDDEADHADRESAYVQYHQNRLEYIEYTSDKEDYDEDSDDYYDEFDEYDMIERMYGYGIDPYGYGYNSDSEYYGSTPSDDDFSDYDDDDDEDEE